MRLVAIKSAFYRIEPIPLLFFANTPFNFNWGTRKKHKNVLSLVLFSKLAFKRNFSCQAKLGSQASTYKIMNFILFTLVIKGTVRVISSDPPCKDDKPINLIKSGEDIIVLFFLELKFLIIITALVMGKSLLLRNCNWNNHLLNRNHWVKAFKGLLHVLSMKCPIYEMSYVWNVLIYEISIYEMSIYEMSSMKCPIYKISFYEMSLFEIFSLLNVLYEMSYLLNVLYEMSYLWNVLSMKCLIYEISIYEMSIYEMPSLLNVLYKMSCVWNVISMKCPVSTYEMFFYEMI